MGLFMDAEGIPIAFGLFPGNDNEQNTMIPLEKKMLEKFDLSRFVVCTDAGLSSAANRHFNDYAGEDSCRSFITTQSIKKLKGHLKEWALDPKSWYLSGKPSPNTFDLRDLDEEKDKVNIYFKSRWIKKNPR